VEFDTGQILPNIGAAVTLGLGMMAIISPEAASKFVSLEPKGPIGVSGIRATYGGFFAAMGLFVLITQSAPTFTLLGIGWAGAAGLRAVSVVVDRSRSLKNVVGILFEAAVAALLLVRW
jgi:hypothetical protein